MTVSALLRHDIALAESIQINSEYQQPIMGHCLSEREKIESRSIQSQRSMTETLASRRSVKNNVPEGPVRDNVS